jgi:hypothetical protein
MRCVFQYRAPDLIPHQKAGLAIHQSPYSIVTTLVCKILLSHVVEKLSLLEENVDSPRVVASRQESVETGNNHFLQSDYSINMRHVCVMLVMGGKSSLKPDVQCIHHISNSLY